MRDSEFGRNNRRLVDTYAYRVQGRFNGLFGQNVTGNTPLMWAVRRGDADAVEALLADYADINLCDCNGDSIMDIARLKGNARILDLLNKCGGDWLSQRNLHLYGVPVRTLC